MNKKLRTSILPIFLTITIILNIVNFVQILKYGFSNIALMALMRIVLDILLCCFLYAKKNDSSLLLIVLFYPLLSLYNLVKSDFDTASLLFFIADIIILLFTFILYKPAIFGKNLNRLRNVARSLFFIPALFVLWASIIDSYWLNGLIFRPLISIFQLVNLLYLFANVAYYLTFAMWLNIHHATTDYNTYKQKIYRLRAISVACFFIVVFITNICVTDSTLIMMLISAPIVILYFFFEYKIKEGYYNDLSKFISFGKNEDKSAYLELKMRDARNSNHISIETVRDFHYKTHEAELVYTGATVGGIHMGGFHVNPAYKTAIADNETGKCRLTILFDGEQDRREVTEVFLTDDLIEEAKKDPIVKKFLRGKKLYLRRRETKAIKEGKELYANALKFGLPNAEYIYKTAVYFPSMLTIEEGQRILKWISGE